MQQDSILNERVTSATFLAGELIADRFRITRILGSGGGGEVYEAEDLELHGKVALKLLRPDIAENEEAVRRFRREVQLARKITHPNVCRIHDLFQTQKVDGNGITRKFLFLSMELLKGETLADRISRRGKMRSEQALPIIRQIVDGLSAAHQSGIIHRDLKSENILLVDDENLRAVIMDFGLAFSKEAHRDSQAITRQGTILGTVAYMAPEQLQGHVVSFAADIYALGVVIYEMVTGALPFDGDSMVSTIARKLTMEPPPPRDLAPDIDKRWEAVILRCLQIEPEGRFASALEVLQGLEGEVFVALPQGVQKRRKMRSLRAIVFLLFAIAAGLFLWRSGYLSRDSFSHSKKVRDSVAVLGFKDLSGKSDTEWLSTALSEMLTTELAAGERLRAIPGENVAKMKIDLDIAEVDSLGRDSLARVRSRLNADYVVLGSYLVVGAGSAGQIRLDVHLQDTRSGDTVVSLTQTGSEGNLFELVSATGTQLRQKIDGGIVSVTSSGQVRASLPSSVEATRYYSEGLDKLRQFDAMAARELFEKAVSADPNFALAHSALAETWESLGYDDRTLAEGKKALDLSGPISREDRLLIEARYRMYSGEYEKAIEIYRSLFTFYPDNLDYGIGLQTSLSVAGLNQEAMQVVKQLRSLPPPLSNDPLIDMAEADEFEQLNNPKQSLAISKVAVEKSLKRGARLEAAIGYDSLGFEYMRLGELDSAMTAYEASRSIYEAAGDQFGVVNALNGIARVAGYQGDLNRAETSFRQVLDVSQQIGNLSMVVSCSSSLAFTLWKKGELNDADKAIHTTFDLEDRLSDKTGIGYIRRTAGLILRDQGQLQKADALYQGWIADARKDGWDSATAWLLYGRSLVLLDQNKLEEARKAQQEALQLRTETGERVQAAESKQALASVLLEAGQFSEAEKIATESAGDFHELKQPEDEGSSRVVLARCLIAAGRIADAQLQIDQATALMRNTQNFTKRISLVITSSTLKAQAGKTPEARKSLLDAIGEAHDAGFVRLEMEAQLALGRIENSSGDTASGQKRLKDIAARAKQSDFLLIASHAAP